VNDWESLRAHEEQKLGHAVGICNIFIVFFLFTHTSWESGLFCVFDADWRTAGGNLEEQLMVEREKKRWEVPGEAKGGKTS